MTLRERLEQRDLLELVEPICRKYSVTIRDLESPRGFKAVADARHEIWATLYARGCWSYPRLGQLFDRDHRTVMEGVRKVRAEKPWLGQSVVGVNGRRCA